MKRILISAFVCGILLFLWSGITQVLPWGVPTAQNVNVQTLDNTKQTESANVVKLEPNSLTTAEFESQFLNKISIYSTDDTYSWIVTNPIRNDYSGYFFNEFLTQLIVGLFLSIILSLTASMNLQIRLALIGMIGLIAVAGTYGQLMNWWGLPRSYGLGVGINLIIGWLIASLVVVLPLAVDLPVWKNRQDL